MFKLLLLAAAMAATVTYIGYSTVTSWWEDRTTIAADDPDADDDLAARCEGVSREEAAEALRALRDSSEVDDAQPGVTVDPGQARDGTSPFAGAVGDCLSRVSVSWRDRDGNVTTFEPARRFGERWQQADEDNAAGFFSDFVGPAVDTTREFLGDAWQQVVDGDG